MPPPAPHIHLRRTSDRPDPSPLPYSCTTSKNAPANGKNTDSDLFKNLVEIVPLVDSLMDRRANPSFRQRASVVYTPAPKVSDFRGKRIAQPTSAVKQRNNGDNLTNGHACATDDISLFKEDEDVKKNTEETTILREKLDDLHKLLSEKDEALKSREDSVKQISTEHATIDHLRHNVTEKEMSVKSINAELSNAENKLGERQAALEKLEFEANSSKTKVQELQEDLDSMKFEKFAYTLLFQELSNCDSEAHLEDNITSFQQLDYLPHVDYMTEAYMNQMEEARVAYYQGIVFAKENPCEDSLASAVEARKKLESFVF